MLKITMMMLVLSMPAFAQAPPPAFKPDAAMQQAMKADQERANVRAKVRLQGAKDAAAQPTAPGK